MRVCVGCGRRTEEGSCPEDGLPTIREGILAHPEGPPNLAGRCLGGRYRIEALLGEGGMGWVFRARHTVTGQRVAVKVMRPETLTNRSMIRRFFLEARSCSQLRQPHTIKVHDFGVSDDGYPFYVMELLEGESYREVLERNGALPVEEALRVGTQVCKSLAEAHDAGLVHRDLKPSNLWRTSLPGEGVYVKVLDFGLVKPIEPSLASHALTDSGAVMGTPRYMAPEQLAQGRLDGRTDLYALGVTLFELVTGRPPFPAATVAELCELRLREAPPHLLDEGPADTPPRLANLVSRLLADRPDDRPPSASAVLDELQFIAVNRDRDTEASLRRKGTLRRAVLLPGLLVVVTLALWGLWPHAPSQAPDLDETAAPHVPPVPQDHGPTSRRAPVPGPPERPTPTATAPTVDALDAPSPADVSTPSAAPIEVTLTSSPPRGPSHPRPKATGNDAVDAPRDTRGHAGGYREQARVPKTAGPFGLRPARDAACRAQSEGSART